MLIGGCFLRLIEAHLHCRFSARSLRFLLPRAFCSHASASTNVFTMRTHNCGQLRHADAGKTVTLFGWLAVCRHRFLVLRDAYGVVQVRLSKTQAEAVKKIPNESVLRVDGTVVERGPAATTKIPTGAIEVDAAAVEVVNAVSSEKMPISLNPHQKSSEQTTMKYRYLQLRTPEMQHTLRLRSTLVHSMRRFLVEEAAFVDVETPTLFRRTPGGAAEFLVPASSPNRGQFYSLPQSPQQFKQLLMIGGVDRYFQIARCYRDELSKVDRQPEFTQVDLEMSFTTQEQVMQLVENLIVASWPPSMALLCPSTPFERLTYADAQSRYGSDKPDLRIPWQIEDCTDLLRRCLQSVPEEGPWIASAFVAKGATNAITSKSLKEIRESVKDLRDIANAARFDVFTAKSQRWFKQLENAVLIDRFGIVDGDALVVCWGEPDAVRATLGHLRNRIGGMCDLRSAIFRFVWIVDFPLFIRNRESGKLESAHHPFTAPIDKHAHYLQGKQLDKKQLENITAQHYDLVLNGVELGGGSIRIHDAAMQRRVLQDVLDENTAELEHLLSALAMGAPPHGGFALGLDRYTALLVGDGDPSTPIRRVIAFPKTKSGRCAMSGAPVSPRDAGQLRERYGIAIVNRDQADEGRGDE